MADGVHLRETIERYERRKGQISVDLYRAILSRYPTEKCYEGT